MGPCLFFAAMLFSQSGGRDVAVRPIDTAVVACYFTEGWVAEPKGPGLVFAIWPDGTAIWSDGPQWGRAPYRTAKIDRAVVDKWLDRLQTDGFFGDPELNYGYFAYDAGISTLSVNAGSRKVKMGSFSMWIEDDHRTDAIVTEIAKRQGRPRLEIMKARYQQQVYERMAWNELHDHISALKPKSGQLIQGRFAYVAKSLCWKQE